MHDNALYAKAIYYIIMRCTISYSGVPVGVLRGMVAYCAVGWFTLRSFGVMCVRVVYCVFWVYTIY